MAATEELKVKVSADVAGAVAGLKQVEKELDKTGAEAIQSSKDVNVLSASLNKTNTSLAKSGAAVQKSTKDYTNFGRVLQDLPFGFTGIQNNLTQLIPAAGAAGLAFSALISALTFAQVGFGAWTRGMGGSKKTLDDLKESLEEYVKSLDLLSSSRIKGSQDAQEELVKLKTLYDATQNQNIAIGKRKQLVDELQDQYPKYFKNISDETILAGGAQKAYEKLSAAILASSKARAAQDLIVDIQKQVLVIDQQITDAIGKQANAIIASRKANDEYKKTKSLTAESAYWAGQLGKASKDEIVSTGEKNRLYAKRNDLLKQAGNLTKAVTDLVVETPEILLDPTGNLDKSKEKVKEAVKKLQGEFRDFISPEFGITIRSTLELAQLRADKNVFDTASKKILKEKLEAKGPIPLRVNVVPEPSLDDKEAKAFIAKLNTIIRDAASSGLSGIGESIGAAIASGADPLKAAFTSIIGTVSDLISQMGKALVEYGVAKTALDTILKGGLLIPGGVAIAAGVAAIAAAALLKNSFKPHATGGVIPPGFPNDSYYARLTSGERVLTPSQNKEWENRNIGRAGGMMAVSVSGDLQFRGDRFRAALVQSNKKGGLFI